MTTKIKALLSLAATVVLFTFVVIVARFTVTDVPQMYVLFIRTLVASIAFLPFFIKSKVWNKPKFKELMLVSSLSTVNLVFFMWGIKYTSASASQLIYAAMPILTILVTTFFFKNKYSLRTIIGVVIGFTGILFIIYTSAVEKGETISGGIIGNLAVVIAMLGWLAYILLSKKYSRYFTPVEIGATSLLLSFFVTLILAIIQFNLDHRGLVLSQNLILAGLYLGLCGSFLTYILIQYAIKYLSPLTVNLSSYIQPILTTAMAMILLGEKMTLTFLFGSMMVLFGVFISATLEFYFRNTHK